MSESPLELSARLDPTVAIPAIFTLSKFVWPSTSISFAIVTLPPDTLIPFLAVINRTESIFVTSSYVNVPPMLTLPEKTPLVAVITPEKLPPILSKGPENFVAVIIPLDFILWLRTLLKVWIPGPVTLVSYVNAIYIFLVIYPMRRPRK